MTSKNTPLYSDLVIYNLENCLTLHFNSQNSLKNLLSDQMFCKLPLLNVSSKGMPNTEHYRHLKKHSFEEITGALRSTSSETIKAESGFSNLPSTSTVVNQNCFISMWVWQTIWGEIISIHLEHFVQVGFTDTINIQKAWDKLFWKDLQL